VIVRCTSKLLAVIRPARLADSPPDGQDWYANLLWFSRRKCLLLAHAATLFTIGLNLSDPADRVRGSPDAHSRQRQAGQPHGGDQRRLAGAARGQGEVGQPGPGDQRRR